MKEEIKRFNNNLNPDDQKICEKLASLLDENLHDADNKIWHAHPVWFLDGNPIVGYSKQKAGIRLMFWSGQGFDEKDLNVHGIKFMDASIFYIHVDGIDEKKLKRWLAKAINVQWDYKNIVKRKGKLIRIK